MKKTHKKILGFVGLGFVAAVTTVAAAIPAPMASAVTSVVDNITVRVNHNDPELTMSTDSGDKITNPSYSFRVGYDNVSSVTVTLVNKNDAGETLYDNTIWTQTSSGERGEKTFDLNLNDYGGYGNFTIKAVALGEGDVPIERILTVKYSETPSETGGDEDEEPKVDVDIPEETVVTTTFNLYDESRQEIKKTLTVDNPNSTEELDLSDLPDGVYWLETVSKNQHGDVISTKWERVVIDTDGDPEPEDIPIVIEDIGEEISKVTITVTNSDDQVVAGETILNPNPGDTVTITIPHNLPAGIYTITTRYYDTNDQVVKTVVEQFIKSDGGGHIIVPVEPKVDSVTTIETEIYNDKGEIVRVLKADRETGVMEVYDANGNLILTVPDGYKDGRLTIVMEGLDSGDYTGVIMYKNKYGHLVGNTKTIRIHWDAGKAIIVPDTGGFLQGLNISREDYLITGAVVFMIIGVVAFGVVRRNRR